MSKISELIKRTFNIWCENLWLKEIDRAIDRYQKTQSKANHEYFVMKKLCERYNELYGGNLLEVKDGN